MSNNYDNDGFESDSMGRQSANHFPGESNEKKHVLKLSVDFLAVKDMKVSANITVQYSLRLLSQAHHQFKSQPPTPVNSGVTSETKLTNAFASYDFLASKSDLLNLFQDNMIYARVIYQPQGQELGTATVELRELLTAPLKKTPQATVRVSDQYLPIRDSQGITKGLIRCILYLQDLGETAQQNSQQQQLNRQHSLAGQGNNVGENNGDYQTVWQLELWKRSEEAKFKAWLKQREIERIEEVTMQWKNKEAEREKQFGEAMVKVGQLESKARQKALDLQRREEKIIQLEEELKHKIGEVGRQLTLKEEEIMNVKKRFKEERSTLEMDKKRLQQQTEELKARCEAAEAKLLALKRDVDESPLSVLRQEIAQKTVELLDSESRAKQAIEERDEARRKFELVKKDMVTLKKQMDKEQKETLLRQAEELEKLKIDIRNKQVQEEERREINSLKMQLQQLTLKLSEVNKAAPETINERQPPNMTTGTVNPFLNQPAAAATQTGPQRNLFLDNFAKGKSSPLKSLGAVGVNQAVGSSELERLLKEREELLRTGIYSNEDPLIMELDRQLRATQLRMAH